MLKFDLVFDSPSGYAFHIGNSESNMAVNTLGSTHSEEIFNDGTTLKVHTNQQPSPLSAEQSFISQNVDIVVGDGFILAENSNQQKYYHNNNLFSLSGVADYDVYLGMNRLIKEPLQPQPGVTAPGKGLCHVKISALTCI